jgi:SulP family sulfate permease
VRFVRADWSNRSTSSLSRLRSSRPTQRDAVASVSIALILVPQAIAYAALAGLPPATGLVAAALPPMVASAFGSSIALQTGPVALTSLLTLGLLADKADVGTEGYIALAGLLAVLIGCVRLVIGGFQAGRIANLMTRPIVVGFTTGAALLIMSSQIPGVFGRTGLDGHVFGRALLAVSEPAQWHLGSLGFAGISAVLVVASARVDRRMPGVLFAVIIGIIVSRSTGYAGPIVGELPTTLPSLQVDLPWASALALLIPASIMALVDFAEPAAIARRYADEDGTTWNPSREFVGQGAANVVSGLSGGYPVGGSFSRSSIGRLAGAQTRWTGVLTGVLVLCFLPFTAVLHDLPKAVLAGIVVVAVYGLFAPMTIAVMWSKRRGDAVVAVITFAMTVGFAPRIDRAIVVAVCGEALLIVYRKLRDRFVSATDGGKNSHRGTRSAVTIVDVDDDDTGSATGERAVQGHVTL